MASAKPARAKKKRMALVNIMEAIGSVKVIKMAGREKAPGLRVRDWEGEDDGGECSHC